MTDARSRVTLQDVADRAGVRPIRYGALPPACAALNEVQIAVQRLTVRAAMTGSRELTRVLRQDLRVPVAV